MSTPERTLDRTAFSVVSLAQADDDLEYWLSRTPHERLRAVELIRQTLYGYTDSSAGLQRVFEVAQRTVSANPDREDPDCVGTR
jgi:hypothetical protein